MVGTCSLFPSNSTAECLPVKERVVSSNLTLGAGRKTTLMNICSECDEVLLFPIEWRYGMCAVCISIVLEDMDRELTDLWYNEGGHI